MSKSTFYSQLAEILDTDASNLHPNTELRSLEWSSLAIVSFIAFAHENFDMILEPRKLTTCGTVGDLMFLLDGKIAA